MGRFTAGAARLGAHRVIGIDLSVSVEAARQFTSHLPNTGIVQADLYQLPFKSPFDLVFSIGVIHHLPDPPAGLNAIGKHVQPDGLLFAWVYGYENNGWIRNVVNPIRERITARLVAMPTRQRSHLADVVEAAGAAHPGAYDSHRVT